MSKFLLGALIVIVTVWSFLVPDAPLFQRPELARIFFWHFPCPMLQLGFMFFGIYCCLRYFVCVSDGFKLSSEADRRGQELWDLRAESALELGFVFSMLTLISGMVFSLAQWGALWQNDPRQTSYLFSVLIYGGYFAVRTAFADPERRAGHSAAYMLAAFLPVIFLVLVFPRLPQVQSFHPSDSILSGQIKGQYAYVIISTLITVTLVSLWAYRLRIRAGLLTLEKNDDNLETSRVDSAPVVMARPFRVHDEDRGSAQAP
jgi:heme exporter protein C